MMHSWISILPEYNDAAIETATALNAGIGSSYTKFKVAIVDNIHPSSVAGHWMVSVVSLTYV